MQDTTKGGHEWVIEFLFPPSDIEQFTRALDAEIQQLNSDYEAKRYKSLTMQLPTIHIARKGLFYDWLEVKKKLGGQHKVPRLSNNRELLEILLEMNA